MKATDLREKAMPDLVELRKALVGDLFQNRLKNFTNRLDDTSAVRKTRRDLARVLTVIRELERRASGEAVSAEPKPAKAKPAPAAQAAAAAAVPAPAAKQEAGPEAAKPAARSKARAKSATAEATPETAAPAQKKAAKAKKTEVSAK